MLLHLELWAGFPSVKWFQLFSNFKDLNLVADVYVHLWRPVRVLKCSLSKTDLLRGSPTCQCGEAYNLMEPRPLATRELPLRNRMGTRFPYLPQGQCQITPRSLLLLSVNLSKQGLWLSRLLYGGNPTSY